MKKNGIRLLALMMCVVMVLGVVPGEANAVELDGVQLPQMQTISIDENQIYTITECEDLLYLADAAANNPDVWYDCVYSSYEEFVIDQNVKIPNNMFFNCQNVLVVSDNATLTIEGTLIASRITVNGTVNLKGNLQVFWDTGNDDLVKINYIDNGWVDIYCLFENDVELQEIIDMANAAVLPWHYYAYANRGQIHIGSPVVLPENVTLRLMNDAFNITGAPITINGVIEFDAFDAESECIITNDLIVNNECMVFDDVSNLTFTGDVTVNGSLRIWCDNVTFEGAVKNNWVVQVKMEIDGKGKAIFKNPDLYNDQTKPGGGPFEDGSGVIAVIARESDPLENAVIGLDMNDFKKVTFDEEYNIWYLSNYRREEPSKPTEPSEPTEPSDPSVHEHTLVTDPAVAPTCLSYGSTEGAHCATCGEVLAKPEVLAPLGHFYGLTATGDSDCWNPKCLTCGALRVINPNHLTASMYRMYNPNSGEHFYTGSLEERQTLEAAGWKYEGVGFTICANTGDPVYRLYEPVSGEHLYTMDTAEVERLVAAGWINEGIALNSCPTKEVPQYRLYNPNTTIGAYHFTASIEERDVLLAAGWQDQGIGFYSCWQ